MSENNSNGNPVQELIKILKEIIETGDPKSADAAKKALEEFEKFREMQEKFAEELKKDYEEYKRKMEEVDASKPTPPKS